MITFALSSEALTEQIYALSALHNILHSTPTVPPALCRDQAPALRQAISYAFSRVCAALIPVTADCDPGDGTSDTITVAIAADTASGGSLRQGAVRRLLEQAVVSEVLADTYRGYDSRLASTYSDASATTLASLRSALIPCATAPSPTATLSVRPHR